MLIQPAQSYLCNLLTDLHDLNVVLMLLEMLIPFVTLSMRSEVTGCKYHQLLEVPVTLLRQIQSYFYGANEPGHVIPLFVDFKLEK